MTASKKNRVVNVLVAAVTGAFSVQQGMELYDYGVPMALILSCCMATWAVLLVLADRIEKSWTTRVHRCTTPGCEFTVRLRDTSAVESRRWQEAAASHPDHRL